MTVRLQCSILMMDGFCGGPSRADGEQVQHSQERAHEFRLDEPRHHGLDWGRWEVSWKMGGAIFAMEKMITVLYWAPVYAWAINRMFGNAKMAVFTSVKMFKALEYFMWSMYGMSHMEAYTFKMIGRDVKLVLF